MARGSAGCAGEGHPHADLQTGRGRLSGPSTGSLPAARGSLFRVRASIVPATAELCAVAAHRDVFKAVRGKERASRSEDRSCGEWLVAVVVADVQIRVQQTEPLEVDARHAARL